MSVHVQVHVPPELKRKTISSTESEYQSGALFRMWHLLFAYPAATDTTNDTAERLSGPSKKTPIGAIVSPAHACAAVAICSQLDTT